MVIRFFKKNNPASFILLPLIAIVLWIIPLISIESYVSSQLMPFYHFVAIPLLKWPLISTLFALLLVLINAFLFNYIISENEILLRPTFLPALFYILLSAINGSFQVLHPVLFSSFFLLLSIAVLLGSYRKDAAFSNVFNAGALVSMAVLFYLPALVYYPLIGVALIIFRPFNWREWVISLFGMLTPFVFLLSYYFLTDKLFLFIVNMRSYFKFIPSIQSNITLVEYFPLVIAGILLLISLPKVVNLSSNSQKSKKTIRLFFWFVLFTIGSFFMAPESSMKYLFALAMPLALFCSNYFLTAKKEKWMELLFVLLVIAILFQQVYKFL